MKVERQGDIDTVAVTQERERWNHGTRENKKASGDAEVAVCEGDDETAVAQTGAEVRAARSTVWNFRIKGSAVESVMNAFTCTGAYAILILYGIKRTENRSMLPFPNEGWAAIEVITAFRKLRW